MLRERSDEALVLADHGRSIGRFHNDLKVMDQRLRGLERRVSTIEANIAELMRAYAKLDLAFSQIDDELKRRAGVRRI